jgi:hypothetical protein
MGRRFAPLSLLVVFLSLVSGCSTTPYWRNEFDPAATSTLISVSAHGHTRVEPRLRSLPAKTLLTTCSQS